MYVEINNYSFAIKNRKAKQFSTLNLYHTCIDVRTALCKQYDLCPLVKEYGSILIYNIMYAVCPNETLKYFKSLSEIITTQREKIYPVKLLRSMGLKSKIDVNTSPILAQILDLLEQEAIKQCNFLISGNVTELNNMYLWKIYYYDKFTLYCQRYDFSKISNQYISEEFRLYLKDKIEVIGYENFKHLFRVYIDITEGILTLLANKSKKQLHSITEISYADVLLMRASLVQRRKYSISTLSEILNYMENFYIYTTRIKNIEIDNPFINIRVHQKYLYVKNTKPITKEALNLIYRNYKVLPRSVQVAFFIYLETGARGDDVCAITVSDLKDNTLRLNLSKTGVRNRLANKPDFVLHKISPNLVTIINKYIADFEEYREQLKTDLVFVYPRPHQRVDSKRRPSVLSVDTFNYWIKQLLINCEAYNDDGSLETATARQIRAELGRRLFKKGNSASDVANKLGNTPAVAEQSYNNMTLEDECETYNNLYSEHFSDIFETPNKNTSVKKASSKKVMYGDCKNVDYCTNPNDCQSCNIRKICSE